MMTPGLPNSVVNIEKNPIQLSYYFFTGGFCPGTLVVGLFCTGVELPAPGGLAAVCAGTAGALGASLAAVVVVGAVGLLLKIPRGIL